MTPTDRLTREDIIAWPVGARRDAKADTHAPLRAALTRHGFDSPFQTAGRHYAMGCVALEITQRCNLDCTLCYLSDLSETVRDLPLAEVFRRIDRIRHDYGPNTNVQITGGDPTLRDRAELIQIVERARERDLVPALFTNGIKATRDLLRDLAAAGLRDVAFHVDLTQERKGYASEMELNQIRREYIQRAQGLGLHVIFNTTVYDGNMAELPALAKFFLDHAEDVRMASFQLQADTGRGVEGGTEGAVSQDGVMKAIRKGTGLDIRFDWPLVGHPSCNRYGSILASGGARSPLFDAPTLFEGLFVEAETLRLDRHRPWVSLWSVVKLAARRPGLIARAGGFAFRKAWALKGGLVRSGGKVRKQTFYIHNFMDAKALDRDRCESCVFMTMTRDGPISMCVHNAKRDAFILQPVRDEGGDAWSPQVQPVAKVPTKRLKGRLRQQRLAQQPETRPLP